MAADEESSKGSAPVGIPLGFVIASTGELAATGFREALAPHGVGPRHYAVLWALSAHAEHTQQQLSARLQIPASRVVALIDDLEERGSVLRLTSAEDRRIRTVQLTESGRGFLAELWRAAETYQLALVGDLTAPEQATLRALLGRVTANLGRGDAADRIRSW